MSRTPLVAGNWKMHGSKARNAELIAGILAGAPAHSAVELLVCPPAVYLSEVAVLLKGSAVALGAQNVSEYQREGMYTGEDLGAMLADVGCAYCIVGHSERRNFYHEDDSRVALKTYAAAAAGLRPIVCIGESLTERNNGETESVLRRQLGTVLDTGDLADLAGMVLAYEPIWAIGTGLTASPEQVQQIHAMLRSEVALRDAKLADSMRILYGGSVKPENAKTLFACADVDGGLIGGASLKAADFLAIVAAAC
jgi:triosephosphate isomerase